MVSTSTTTPADYLASLPQDRCEVISAVRDLILQYLPEGYEETINWGMLSYEVPLEVYPDTYNKKPLSYIALAAQKNYNSLYLMSVYQDPADYQELMDAFAAMGVKPDIGKSCVRFKKLEQLPLETIARLISKTSVQEFIETTKVLQNRKS
ncbi:MAG TPA: DUF1801 domain-containing protein [Anaerolineaceae bacterium]|nr:DUF1801 domain-containing protein [Anaerolineaceae bacterium]